MSDHKFLNSKLLFLVYLLMRSDLVKKSRLRWFGNLLERKDAGDWISECRNMAIAGNARKSRPKKRLKEVVKDDLKKCSLDRG